MEGYFMWNVGTICKIMLFAPIVIGFMAIHRISGYEFFEAEIPKEKWYMDFRDVDLARYNVLLQIIINDIKEDCVKLKRTEEQTKSLIIGFLIANSMIEFKEIFSNSDKAMFLRTSSDIYDQMKQMLQDEEI